MTGAEQQHDIREHFIDGEAAAFFLRRDERADQVLTRTLAPLVDQLYEILARLLHRLHRALDDRHVLHEIDQRCESPVHLRKRSRSSDGIPSISAITMTGSGYAN